MQEPWRHGDLVAAVLSARCGRRLRHCQIFEEIQFGTLDVSERSRRRACRKAGVITETRDQSHVRSKPWSKSRGALSLPPRRGERSQLLKTRYKEFSLERNDENTRRPNHFKRVRDSTGRGPGGEAY